MSFRVGIRSCKRLHDRHVTEHLLTRLPVRGIRYETDFALRHRRILARQRRQVTGNATSQE
jgi:hypothetical protein